MTEDIHVTAQAANSSARVAYVDNDRIVLLYARAFRAAAKGVAVADADLTDPASVLARITQDLYHTSGSKCTRIRPRRSWRCCRNASGRGRPDHDRMPPFRVRRRGNRRGMPGSSGMFPQLKQASKQLAGWLAGAPGRIRTSDPLLRRHLQTVA